MKEYKARQIKRAFKIYKKHGYDHAYRWKVYCQMEEYRSKRRAKVKWLSQLMEQLERQQERNKL
jgi:hypothetical protein